MKAKEMKREYYFSKGVRGKFFNQKAAINLPVYLDTDVAEFIKKVSRKKGNDVGTIVNDWLRKDIGLIQSVK